MSFSKSAILFFAILFNSYVHSIARASTNSQPLTINSPSTDDQPLNSTNDPTLNLVLAAAALPLATDFSDPIASNNSSLGAGQEATTCVKKGYPGMDKYRPTVTDCAMALRRFPSGTDNEGFCNIPSAPCRLPAGASSGKCRVTVDVVNTARATASWAEVGLAALQLIDACKDGDKIAGRTLVGVDDKLSITISKIRVWKLERLS